MQIHFRYFAVVRERLGSDGEVVEVPAGADVAGAIKVLAALRPDIGPLLGRCQIARNLEMSRPTDALADGDELAVIPPVAGGHDGPDAPGSPRSDGQGPGGAARPPRRIAMLATALSLDEVVAAVSGPDRGGIVTFTGAVRRQGQQPNVARLEYEAYEAMATRVLGDIADGIEREWPGTHVAIHHRTGVLAVGDIAVVIAASAPHRAEAFAACRAAIERLKEQAPIWKKEVGDDGSTWIGLGP